nr:MAG TPA: hypothetical protein [Bacteriophage sp.]
MNRKEVKQKGKEKKPTKGRGKMKDTKHIDN